MFYFQVKLIRLVGIMLVVFVRTELVDHIYDVMWDTVGTGILGMMVCTSCLSRRPSAHLSVSQSGAKMLQHAYYRRTVSQTDRQTDRQTERETDRQTDRQTDRNACVHLKMYFMYLQSSFNTPRYLCVYEYVCVCVCVCVCLFICVCTHVLFLFPG